MSYTHCILLQGTFELYSDKYFSLAEWIVVAGAAIGAFAVCVPNLHYLRLYSTISCVLVFIFTIIVVAVSSHDGMFANDLADSNVELLVA